MQCNAMQCNAMQCNAMCNAIMQCNAMQCNNVMSPVVKRNNIKMDQIISDTKMPRKLKIKLYMTVIRPLLLYGAECWTVRKKEEQILEKTEMRMLIRIKGETK